MIVFTDSPSTGHLVWEDLIPLQVVSLDLEMNNFAIRFATQK